MRPEEQAGREILLALESDNYEILSPSLRPILKALLSRGYSVRCVQVSGFHERCFDVILDRPIDESLRGIVSLSNGVECFGNSDEDGLPMGIGFLCNTTHQTIIA